MAEPEFLVPWAIGVVPPSAERVSPAPRRKPKNFRSPIPPLARTGNPDPVSNGVKSLFTGGFWQLTDAKVATTPFPRSLPLHGRLPLSPSLTDRSNPSSGMEAEPSLAEALGMLTGEVPAGRTKYLPANKMRDPQECEEGCYWRWLAHTLLEDVASLKRNLEDTQLGFQELAEQKKAIEDTVRHQERLREELAFMDQSFCTLREDVPRLRLEHETQIKEVEQLEQRRRELKEEALRADAAKTRSIAWQKANFRRVQEREYDAEEGRRQEKTLADKILVDREGLHVQQVELQRLTGAFQALQLEVKELQEKKAPKKGKKGKKK